MQSKSFKEVHNMDHFNHFTSLERYSQAFQNALARYYCDIGSSFEKDDVAAMLVALSRIYTVLAEISVDQKYENHSNDSACSIPEEAIDLRVTDDAIIVRTPNLASKFSSYSRAHSSDYSTVFAAGVRRKMMDIKFEKLKFTKKHISVIGVYEEKTRKIPDADNLDTKAITDAITRLLPGGDGWDNCSFSNANVRSGTIKPGTYFVVSTNYLEPPSISETIKKLKDLFPN